MPRSRTKPLTEVTLALEAAATPARVERAARLFRTLLEEAAPELPEGGVTFVVSNFDLKATLRGQTPEGRQLVTDVISVARSPRSIPDGGARTAAIGRALVLMGSAFRDEEPRLVPKGAKRPIRLGPGLLTSINGYLREAEKATREASGLRGRAELRGTVLRAGRSPENGRPQARVLIAGQPREVAVSEAALAAVLDAVKHGGEHRLAVTSSWLIADDGACIQDATKTVIVGATQTSKLSGAELLKHLPSVSTDSTRELLESRWGDDG